MSATTKRIGHAKPITESHPARAWAAGGKHNGTQITTPAAEARTHRGALPDTASGAALLRAA